MYRCSLCGVHEPCSESMGAHLTSEAHLNCVDIVNKSVPVMVSKPETIACHVCTSLRKSPVPVFRYHVQLNRHLHSEHSLPVKSTAEHSGRSFTCEYCGFKTASSASFTHHEFACKAVPKGAVKYRCHICELTFVTRDESIRHRSTQDHRDAAKRQRAGSAPCDARVRSCPHCYRTFDDLTTLKEHFVAEHPDLLSRCSRCGATFALKQQLSAHRYPSLYSADRFSSSTVFTQSDRLPGTGSGQSSCLAAFLSRVLLPLPSQRGTALSSSRRTSYRLR